jgi:hypothetical protein
MSETTMVWNKFKDLAILFMLGFAIKVFHSNMEDLNRSVQSLNSKVGVVITTTQTHEKEIITLRTQVRELEIKVGSE